MKITKISITTFRNKIRAEQSILDRIQRRRLKWYRQNFRIESIGWPKINQWIPQDRKRKGRQLQSFEEPRYGSRNIGEKDSRRCTSAAFGKG